MTILRLIGVLLLFVTKCADAVKEDDCKQFKYRTKIYKNICNYVNMQLIKKRFTKILHSNLSVKSLGCWGESDSDRAISGDYGTLNKLGCYRKAVSLGFNVFAINNDSTCYTSSNAWKTYKKYGPALCSDSRSNTVYQIQTGNISQKYLKL